jgi:hypothetical protein
MPTLSTVIQYSVRILSQNSKTEEEIKGIEIGKEEAKLSLFADDLIPKRHKKLHQKMPRHYKQLQQSSRIKKINLQKSLAFLYSNNEKTKKKYRKIIPFTRASKK